MLRIFFSIIAIAASAITFISLDETNFLEDWWMYIPMTGLILIAVTLWISSSYSAKPKRKKSTRDVQNPPEKESLADLGIFATDPEESETKSFPPKPDTPNQPEDTPKGVQLSLLPDPPPSESDPNSVKIPNPLETRILTPVLNGFKSALDVHVVGIIRPVSGDYEYKILGTVGQGWIKSRGETFVLKYDLLQEGETTAIHLVNAQGLQSDHLTYSRQPANITSLGVTTVGQTGNLLIVDTISKNGLSHPRAKELLETFGQMYSFLLYKEDPNRPRHEIIAEEMALARSENNALALALVLPQKHDSLSQTYGDALGKVETALSDCLTKASPESRVIKFGELLYGVFTDGRKEKLENWHTSVQIEIEASGGFLTGGVFIGIAVLSDNHQTADDLRSDAKEALLEAYNGPANTVSR